MPVAKGDPAPAFKLAAAPGEEVDLSQKIGREKVVLLFFPLAFSSVCTKEMCTMRDDWSGWENLGANVYGVSIDSPFVTQKFRQELNIPFPILSDFNRDVIRQYDVVHEDLKGMKNVSKRAAFVIDSNGRIAYAWVAESPAQEPPYDEVREAVRNAS